MAIRGKGGGGKNTCETVGNYCSTDGGGGGSSVGAIEGGLTEGEIQTLADLYNNDPTTDKKAKNCPEIVKWFMKEFTDLGHPGSVGSGQYVAKNIADMFNLEHGTEPRPFAVFSTLNYSEAPCSSCDGGKHGHTGMVLGVDGDNVFTLETIGGRAGFYNRSAEKIKYNPANSDYIYTYLDGHVDMSKLSAALGGS